MSIFSKLFKSDKQQIVNQIDNVIEEHNTNLDNVIINLSKDSIYDYSSLKSRVKLVLDYSGSMSGRYDSGIMQKVITQILPLALRFDDDGQLDCFLFSNNYIEIEPCTINNYSEYVRSVVNKSGFQMGGTRYAPVLKNLHSKTTDSIPDFIIYITDGDNSDKPETNEIITAMSNDNCFIMFIGIGNSYFPYLESLDNLAGRDIDNTGFVKFADIENTDDRTLYTKLLSEYSNWLKK